MARRGHNEGTICLRSDGRWVANVSLGKGPDGKTKRKAFYGKTRKEVADNLKQALADQQAGKVVDPKRITLGDFLEQWLEGTVKQTTRCITHENYSILVRTHIIPSLGTTQLSKLTPLQIQQFLNYKLEGGLSTRSVQYLLVLLRRSLGLAVKWGMIQVNVAKLVDPPKVMHREVKPWSPEQARQFLQSIAGDKLEALYVVTVALGLRRGEVLALKWDDVDLEAGSLTVSGSLQRVGGKLQVLDTKTEKSHRTIMLPQMAVTALKSHRTRWLRSRLAVGRHWQDHGFVFTNMFGKPFCPRHLNRQFDGAVKRSGLPKIRFHDLRHGAATMLLAYGVPIKTISEMLGHSDTRMTLDIYSHVVDSMRQEAADQLDRILSAN